MAYNVLSELSRVTLDASTIHLVLFRIYVTHLQLLDCMLITFRSTTTLHATVLVKMTVSARTKPPANYYSLHSNALSMRP